MKSKIFCGIVLFVVLGGAPASAQVTLVMYDNFQAKVLSPDKWFGGSGFDPGVVVLEIARLTNVEPITHLKGLNLLGRGYAFQGSDAGTSSAYSRLLFDDGSQITTIQATVIAKDVQTTGCATNMAAGESRIRIAGTFFNSGTPTPGDLTNDVGASIAVGRTSDSTDPAKVLKVYGVVAQCNNATCSDATVIGRQDLGTLKVNKKTTLRVTWDKPNKKFVFQMGKAPAKEVVYVLDDLNPPGAPNGGVKRLELQNTIVNCTSLPRPVGYISGFFDDVKVNAAAAP